LRLIEAAGMRGFPPRLPEQPIFYPVTNEAYAAKIARDWNTKSGSKMGFVTRTRNTGSRRKKTRRKGTHNWM
jgi:hypothetical protein